MCPMGYSSLCMLAPIAFLLALSFFVLLGTKKADSNGVKIFGYVVFLVTLISAISMVVGGIYMRSCRKNLRMMPIYQKTMQPGMQMKMRHQRKDGQESGKMSCPMIQKQIQQEAPSQQQDIGN